MSCLTAFFGTFDPVVFPDQPGAGHLHLFFGNESVTASSTADTLLEEGAVTCRGGPHNRSAYWTPAVVDGDDVIVPTEIVLYYKTHRPGAEIEPIPNGLQIVANLGPDGAVPTSFRARRTGPSCEACSRSIRRAG